MIELQMASLDEYSHTRDLCVEAHNEGTLLDPDFANFAHIWCNKILSSNTLECKNLD
ncbi:MAG: hypothetical protein ACI92O_000763 [Colwellia sp.]|jgi:hypothetical protein